MEKYPNVFIMGLGVPDPKGIFGTTLGLADKFGSDRVMDMPASENAMTGVLIGAAITGMRPILTHQRVDFALLSLEQLVNQAANWHYMFGGKQNVPLVIRMIIGRGWGQGPQHSQCLHSWFAHVPGLKVVMPTTPYDAKGLLISAVEDNNPVIFLEHRWLHNLQDHVPEEYYKVELGKARVIREGKDLTLVSSSYMTLECIEATKLLATNGVDAEVIDIRSIKPLDIDSIVSSVTKTGRLIVVDHGWKTCGFGAELITSVVEKENVCLKHKPLRVTLYDCPTPTSSALDQHFYPRAISIANKAIKMMCPIDDEQIIAKKNVKPSDVPETSFRGPF